VVFNWCGNAYGTGNRYVFSIGEEFKLLQILPYGDFEDVNNDGILEFIAYDNTFSFWHACHVMLIRLPLSSSMNTVAMIIS